MKRDVTAADTPAIIPTAGLDGADIDSLVGKPENGRNGDRGENKSDSCLTRFLTRFQKSLCSCRLTRLW